MPHLKLSEDKNQLLKLVVDDIRSIDGVVALVLGGSYAEGTATESSDIDLGIYYDEANPFQIDEIKKVAEKYAVEPPTVTGFYDWGQWVNGGAWITTKVGDIDFIYRNINQVQKTIHDGLQGKWYSDFEQQPPYGFTSVIYFAETEICQILYDPSGLIANLKKDVTVYPDLLKTTIVQQALWSATFTFFQAKKFAEKNDIYNTAGCFTRCCRSIIATLFAINEKYSPGDKRDMERLKNFVFLPSDFQKRITSVLSLGIGTLSSKIDLLADLLSEVKILAGSLYENRYNL